MSRRLTLEDIRETAKAHKGVCLNTRFKNCRTTVRWQCHFNHEWEAPIFRVRWGRWCPVCRAAMRERTLKAKLVKKIKSQPPEHWAEKLLRVRDKFTRSWVASILWWSYNLPARDTLPADDHEDCPLFEMMNDHTHGKARSEPDLHKAMKSIGLPAPSLVAPSGRWNRSKKVS